MSIINILEINQTVLEKLTFKSLISETSYYKIKPTMFSVSEEPGVMLQIIDVTQNILVEKYKSETRSLEMANVCVSHELRSPLTSIVASSI